MPRRPAMDLSHRRVPVSGVTLASYVGLPVLVAVACVGLWIATDGSSARAAAVLVCVGLVTATTVVLRGAWISRSHRLEPRLAEGRLLVPGSAAASVLIRLVAAAALLWPVFLVVPAFDGGFGASFIGLVVALMLPLLALPLVASAARGHFALNGWELAPDHVTYRSYNADHTLAWDHVERVELRGEPGARLVLVGSTPPVRVPRSDTFLERKVRRRVGGEREIAVLLMLQSAGAPVLAELLDFYRAHPQARAELGTDAAVERIRRGDFTTR